MRPAAALPPRDTGGAKPARVLVFAQGTRMKEEAEEPRTSSPLPLVLGATRGQSTETAGPLFPEATVSS